MRVQVFTLDPLTDRRWKEFGDRHPRSSMFHSVSWLKARQQTYGYRPIVYTTRPGDQPMKNGMVFCDVNSWLTGQRLVSVPFSAHSERLRDNREGHRAGGSGPRRWGSLSRQTYWD